MAASCPFDEVRGLAAIIMPDDVAEEKVKALLALGAEVECVRPASIVDKKQARFVFSVHILLS